MSLLFSSILLAFLSALPHIGKGRDGEIFHIHHSPDPVNVQNGNFYLPVQDLSLSCFTLPIESFRSYNSVSSKNGSFGKGWTFNYDIQLNVDEQLGLQVVESDGFVNPFKPIESLGNPTASEIEKIVAGKKREDQKYMNKSEGKGAPFYQDYQSKLTQDPDFFTRQKEKYLPLESKISKSGKYISYERGAVVIQKVKSGFIRTNEDNGRVEEFDAKGLLTRISDQNQNFLTFIYDNKSKLSQVNDSCNQFIRFTYNPQGKIVQIQDLALRKWVYDYDPNDRLIRSFSPDGEKIQFTYDKKDRMNSITFLDGTKTAIEYDKFGLVSKQSGPGKKVTTYRYGKEGPSRYAFVEDNEGLKDKYEFFEAEHKDVYTDKNGKKTITQYMACCGKPLSIKNEKGIGDEFKYNDDHRVIAKIDAEKKTVTFEYETRFKKLSLIKYPDGSWLRFVYGNNGNVTYVSNQNGKFVKLAYEPHGKIERLVDEKGNEIVFGYNSTGRSNRIERLLNGIRQSMMEITYTIPGDIDRVTATPNDPGTKDGIQAVLLGFLQLLRPVGIDFEI